MQEWIVHMMDQYGYFGVALLIFVENIFPPIPSELILTFGGFMTTYSNMQVWLVALAATVGSVAGAFVLYGVGKLLPAERLEWMIQRWGRFLGLRVDDVRKAQGWFLQHGGHAVFICRFVPIVRSLISIPAGMAGMRMGSFFFHTLVGTAIWNFVLVSLGAAAGAGWQRIADYMNVYSYIGLAVLAVVGMGILWWLWKRHKSR